MLIATKAKFDINKLMGLLNVEFDVKDLSATHNILGMEIYRERT